jgi:HK97 family phage major capsid protein
MTMQKMLNPRAILVIALALAAVFTVMGHPIVPAELLAGLALTPMMVGDTDMAGLTELLKKQGTAFEEFKRVNDERLASIEKKGYAPEDTVEKVAKINADLTALGKQIDEVAKKANRPGMDAQEGKGLTPEQAEHKQAFSRFLTKGDASNLDELQRKAMSMGSDVDGGYLVPVEMDQMIDRIAPTISAMMRLADVKTISTAKWEKLVKTSGMAMRRVAEGGAGGESTNPKYAKIAIEVFEAEVEPWVYNATLEDSMDDLAADLAEEAAIGFAEGAGSEFIAGNGVGKARGITAYDVVANASYAWGSIGYIASGKAGAFASVAPADKLVALQHSLKSQYRPGAVWLMNDATLGTCRQMKDGSGSYYLWQPDVAGGFGGRFLGSPVEIDDNMPAVAANALSVAYGNFKRGYTIVNRSGTVLIRDNITAKGTTKFNFRRRFGGGVNNYEAIKLLRMATS